MVSSHATKIPDEAVHMWTCLATACAVPTLTCDYRKLVNDGTDRPGFNMIWNTLRTILTTPDGRPSGLSWSAIQIRELSDRPRTLMAS